MQKKIGAERTPLHKAAMCVMNNPDIINALIQAGADVNAKDEEGETPLHGAADENTNPDIIIALVQAGANINAQDRLLGSTPLRD